MKLELVDTSLYDYLLFENVEEVRYKYGKGQIASSKGYLSSTGGNAVNDTFPVVFKLDKNSSNVVSHQSNVGDILLTGKYHSWYKVAVNSYEDLLTGVVWSVIRLYLAVRKAKVAGREKPNASEYKEDIYFWISYWLIDIPVYLFKDFIRDLFKGFWRHAEGTYQRIIDAVFDKI